MLGSLCRSLTRCSKTRPALRCPALRCQRKDASLILGAAAAIAWLARLRYRTDEKHVIAAFDLGPSAPTDVSVNVPYGVLGGCASATVDHALALAPGGAAFHPFMRPRGIPATSPGIAMVILSRRTAWAATSVGPLVFLA